MLQFKDRRWLVFRPAISAVPPLPLGVRSVGCYRVNPSWREKPRQKWFLQLFWGVGGCGRFRRGKDWVTLSPGRVFYYQPGETHDMRAESDSWTYCWITFDHSGVSAWIDAFGLSRPLHRAGKCPVGTFKKIGAALRDGTAAGERRAANLAHALLTEVVSKTTFSRPDSLSDLAKQWMEEHFANPDMGIGEMAEKLDVHRTTLFRRFQEAHGLKPSAYLHNLRVRYGLNRLRSSSLPIQEIAAEAGFHDPNYFARAIRQATGMSPREYRAG